MTFVLMDTNILLRSAQPSHSMHQVAIDAQAELRRRGNQPCIVAQNLIEFRSVATRPASGNGLGMKEKDADAEIRELKALYPLYADEPQIVLEWETLVSTYGAIGNQNHDARIVAAMRVHGISSILTFNVSDFARYPDITVLEPAGLLSPPHP